VRVYRFCRLFGCLSRTGTLGFEKGGPGELRATPPACARQGTTHSPITHPLPPAPLPLAPRPSVLPLPRRVLLPARHGRVPGAAATRRADRRGAPHVHRPCPRRVAPPASAERAARVVGHQGMRGYRAKHYTREIARGMGAICTCMPLDPCAAQLRTRDPLVWWNYSVVQLLGPVDPDQGCTIYGIRNTNTIRNMVFKWGNTVGNTVNAARG
jgi:hypothetical protein